MTCSPCHGIAICSEISPDVRLDLSEAVSYSWPSFSSSSTCNDLTLTALPLYWHHFRQQYSATMVHLPLRAWPSVQFIDSVQSRQAACDKGSTIGIIVISLTIFDNGFTLILIPFFVSNLRYPWSARTWPIASEPSCLKYIHWSSSTWR